MKVRRVESSVIERSIEHKRKKAKERRVPEKPNRPVIRLGWSIWMHGCMDARTGTEIRLR
jgi:hypothetical protein